MMGCPGQEGLIPRITNAMFEHVTEKTTESITFKIEVSYLEIYNEKVRDLLNPSEKKTLKVREHASLGPYVDGLVKTTVRTSQDNVINLLQQFATSSMCSISYEVQVIYSVHIHTGAKV